MSDADPAAPFAAARANIRDTAKWVMAAIAGAVSLVVGSTAFSQLGAMDASMPRLWWAYWSLAVGAAMAWIVFTRAVAVLKSELITLREIMGADKSKPLMVMARDRAAKKLEGQLPLGSLEAFHAHYETQRQIALTRPDPADQAGLDAQAKAARELAALAPYQSFASQVCVTEFVILRFDSLMAALVFPGVVAMGAFLAFAWCANPGPGKGPPPVYQVRVVGPGSGEPSR